MRTILPFTLERGRITDDEYFGTLCGSGPYGAFILPSPVRAKSILRIIASGAEYPESDGWEHVSVSLADRTPLWEEMAYVKDLFWLEDECVIQFHPPKRDYVNFHQYCLHLWRDTTQQTRLPPTILLAPPLAPP